MLEARPTDSRNPATSRPGLVSAEKPKPEPDAVVERIDGMTEVDREALVVALRDQADDKRKKTG